MPRVTGFSKEKAAAAIRKEGISVLVASTPENVFYASGLPVRHMEHNPALYITTNQYPYFVVIDEQGDEALMGWQPLTQNAPTWIKNTTAVHSRKEGSEILAAEIKKRRGSTGKIGVEPTFPLFAYEKLVAEFGASNIKIADKPFNEMRLHKSPEEVAILRKSASLAEKATMGVINALKPGVSDLELLEIAKTTMIKGGALGWDHLSLTFPNQSGIFTGTGKTLNKEDAVGMDFGAIVEGYCSDMNRQATVGKTPDEARKAFNMVRDIQGECAAAIKPGRKVGDVFRVCEESYRKRGNKLESYMIGHSIGIQTEENPLIRPDVDLVFEENMVFNIELYAMAAGRRVGNEDMYLVKEGGVDRITTIAQDIFDT